MLVDCWKKRGDAIIIRQKQKSDKYGDKLQEQEPLGPETLSLGWDAERH